MQEFHHLNAADKTETPAAKEKETTPPPRKSFDWFWKFATLFSFVVNVILVLVLLVAGLLIFEIKNGIASPLIGGLYQNFVKMDEAHIKTTIQVSDTLKVVDTIPVVFDLPLNADTTVVLTQDTAIPNTIVRIQTGIMDLNAPAIVTLPKGTPLNIHLALVVPVSTTIPVVLNVPVKLPVVVDIPLDKTELHEPFTNLAALVSPYDKLLNALPSSWPEIVGIKPKK